MELSIPLSYSGDTLGMLTIIKGMIQGEWFPYFGIKIASVGAPFGLNMADYPMPEQLHLLLMKLLSLFNPDPIQVLNTYYLLSFPLVTLTFTYACRQFRVRYPTAVACGLLYSFLPFHLMRYSHIFYFPYFMIPLFVLVCLWMWSKKPTFFKGSQVNGFRLDFASRKAKLSILIALLAGGFGIYYAFFFCCVLALAGLSAAFYRRNYRHFAGAALIIALVGASSALTGIPNFIYKMKHGTNPHVAQRGAAEAEYLGLKLTNILTPRSNDRFEILRRVKAKYQSGTGVAEGYDESLGLVGILAFFGLLLRFLIGRDRRTLFDRLGLLLVGAVLLGQMGGLGAYFALLVSPLIRCYNRISILIAAFAYLGCALWLTYIGKKWGRKVELTLATLILLFGIYEQATQDFRHAWAAPSADYDSDKEFIQKIEAASPEVGAMVLQLPFMYFPEEPPILRMNDYSHFRAAILSKKTRWSYGAMKGRPESTKIQAWSQVPINLRAVREAGYTGIYIDRFGFADNGKAVENDLSKHLKVTPIISQNGRLVYFRLNQG